MLLYVCKGFAPAVSVMNLVAVVMQMFAMWCNQSLLAAGTRTITSVDNMAHHFNNGKLSNTEMQHI